MEDPSELMVRVAAARDASAFRLLYDHFMPRVVGYLRSCGCALELAEELAQDVLATVWQSAEAYNPARGQVSTWIFCVARNRMIDRVRRSRRPLPDPEDPAWVGPPPPSPEAMLGKARDRERLHRAIGTLPPEQSDVLRASYVEGRSLADYAEAADLPLGTVKTRARLALQRLRELLSSHHETDHA